MSALEQAALVQRARAGDLAAGGILAALCRERIRTLAVRWHSKNPAAPVEDLEAEGALAAHQAVRDYRPGAQSYWSYAATKAHHAMKSFVRKFCRFPKLLDDEQDFADGPRSGEAPPLYVAV